MPIPEEHRRVLANLPHNFTLVRRAYDTIEEIVTDERFLPALDEIYDDEQLRNSLNGDNIREHFRARGIEIPDEAKVEFVASNWHNSIEIVVFTDSATYCIGIGFDSTTGFYDPCS